MYSAWELFGDVVVGLCFCVAVLAVAYIVAYAYSHMRKMKAVCVNCEHLLEETYFSRWHAYPCRVCKARPLPRDFNYVAGVRSPQRYARCASFNKDGKCSRFEEKEEGALL